MKILLISGSLPPMRCGIGDYTWHLAQALAANPNVAVGILTSSGAAPSANSAVEIFPVMKDWTVKKLGKFLHIVKQWKPDIIHVQYPTQGYQEGHLPKLTPIISTFLGIKVVRTWHEIPRGRELRGFLVEAVAPGPYVVVRPEFYQSVPRWLRPMISGRAGGFIQGASSIPASVLSGSERRALNRRFAKGRSRLIAYFGFLYPLKGVDMIFDIADPLTDHLIIVGDGRPTGTDEPYCNSLRLRANQEPWQGGVTFTGFLSDEETADVLAAADAVVLPFRTGGGIWNSSINAVVLQGTPVITTSADAKGYDAQRNVYYAAPGDIAQLKRALGEISGRRRGFNPDIDRDEWQRIAKQHLDLYKL